MEVKFEKTDAVRGVIDVNITEADYAEKVDKKLKEIGKNHVVPGFRKGHISLGELRKRFGRDVKSDAINDVVFTAVYDYIKDNNIHILGQPIPAEMTEIDLKQTDYSFKYDVALWPELNIKIDKSVTLPFYNIEVTDAMIADEDKAMRERMATQGPADVTDEKAIVKGSLMELNEDGTVKEGDGAIQVVNAIVAPFVFKDKDEAALFADKHVGDKVVFNPYKAAEGNVAELSSMLQIDKEQAADVKSNFELSIAEIIVAKPAELNQEFYDAVFGKDKVHDEKEYKEALKQMIESSLAPNSMQLFMRDAHDWLAKEYDGMQIDNELVKKWLMRTEDNLNAGNIDEEYEKMLPGIKWEIISGEVEDKLGIKVEEADVKARATFIARQQLMQYGIYNMDPSMVDGMVDRILGNENMRRRIVNDVEEIKMFGEIREKVTLDTKTVTLDEFRKIANGE